MGSLKINSTDLRRIYKKARRADSGLRLGVEQTLTWMGEDYKAEVRRHFGKYSQDSNAMITFDLDIGNAFTVWEELSPGTIAEKEEMGKAPYMWTATWETYESVICEVSSDSNGLRMFAGIDGTESPEAFDKAMAVEFGMFGSNQGPQRHLFTLLNDIYATNKDKVLKQLHAYIDAQLVKAWRG